MFEQECLSAYVARYLNLRRWLLLMHRSNFPFLGGGGGPNLGQAKSAGISLSLYSGGWGGIG